MKTYLQKWGNSLAVRIPSAFASEAKINESTPVDISLVDGNIIVKPLPKPKYTLKELVAKITPENRHRAIDSDPPVGNEVW